MSTFKSKIYPISAHSADVFTFLNSFNNFETLLPDGVKEWKATETTCSFSVPNIGTIALEMGDNTPTSTIKYATAEGGSPYKANIVFNIVQQSGNSCEVNAEFKAELNAMFAMLAKNPINNFLKMAMEKLQAHFA